MAVEYLSCRSLTAADTQGDGGGGKPGVVATADAQGDGGRGKPGRWRWQMHRVMEEEGFPCRAPPEGSARR